MEENFITVKTFGFSQDVAIVQTYMEMRGIEVYMKNFTLIFYLILRRKNHSLSHIFTLTKLVYHALHCHFRVGSLNVF